MKVIVLIVVMTMYGCGFKPSVSCNVNDINTVITDCREQPQFGISKEFQLNSIAPAPFNILTGLSKSQNFSKAFRLFVGCVSNFLFVLVQPVSIHTNNISSTPFVKHTQYI